MTNANAPCTAVGTRTDRPNVAGEVDEAVRYSCRCEYMAGAVGRVFFAHAAEIQLHAGERQKDLGPLPAYVGPSDQTQRALDMFSLRKNGFAKIPAAAQDAGGEVEQSVALYEAGVAVFEQPRGFI